MKLYNTLTRKMEEFEPINPPKVGMYCCGPTVYLSPHIGNMSKYVGDDVLRRVLEYNGYQVTHVMNITDVGHLVSDADEGGDKVEEEAVKEKLSVWEVAKKYEKEFFDAADALNILRPNIVARATEHIQEQIDLIKRLEQKGYTYQTDSAVYFDVSRFPDYGKLSGQELSEKKTAARADVVVDVQKKHPYDFALWFKRVGRFANHTMHWDAPWGDGFPGWHIECSAMSMRYLGESFDIHTGGVDHIGVHHPAEIAQSEAATGKPFVKYWVHRVFIVVDGKKMSKSLGNFYTLKDVTDKGFEPMALRYFFLTGQYRITQNFTWEALSGAQNALGKLRNKINKLNKNNKSSNIGCAQYEQDFLAAINDDLNMPQALAVVWKLVDDNSLPAGARLTSLLRMDKVLGLRLGEKEVEKKIPEEVERMLAERERLRQEKNFVEADKIRKKIRDLGYTVSDEPA